MNSSDVYGVPADRISLQLALASSSNPVFPYLDAALPPRIVSTPKAVAGDASGRFMQKPIRKWSYIDTSTFTAPAYRPAPTIVDEQEWQHGACWNASTSGEPAGSCREHSCLNEESNLEPVEGFTALIAACVTGNAEAVQALLEDGAAFNTRDHEGLTALDHAVQSGQFAVAEILSAAGAVWTCSRHEATEALLHAIIANLPNLARCAMSYGADITLTDDIGRMPLHHAVRGLRNRFVPFLVSAQAVAHPDADGNTPLHLAAIAGNPPAMELLLARRAVVDLRNRDGNTALCCACSLPCLNVVMLLLRAGADKAAENRFGQRPLHIACLHGQAEIVCMLLALGADPNARTTQGETALGIACRCNIPAIASTLMLAGGRH